MTSRLILLTLAAALTFVACPTTTPEPSSPPPQTGSPAPPTPPTPPTPPQPTPPTPPTPPPPTPPTPQPGDTTAPTVLSISPNFNGIGVEANAKIRIEFSEPMNQTATEAAFQSTDMPIVTFLWSPNGKRLEIDPVGDLELTNVGREYNFTIQNTATDLAGNALTLLTSRFRTFRELKKTFTSVGSVDGNLLGERAFDSTSSTIIVGDTLFTLDNDPQKGFLSFDLTPLETDGLTIPQRITAAKLRIYQASTLGSPYINLQVLGRHLLAAHVAFGPGFNLSKASSNTVILHDLGEISSDATVGYKETPNALESVRDDWQQRIARENRSQFMLFFPLATNGDGLVDSIRINAGEALIDQPQLEVTFLVP